ncbi:MAG: amino acid adenylation domain-containing protein, partial [Polyangiaceae bacterium]
LPLARGRGTSRQTTCISNVETADLRRFARELGVTTSTLVQGAFALLLSRYTGVEDVIFGLTVSGRPAALAGIDTMLGLFINTIPVAVRCSVELSVGEWLRALQEASVEANAYDHAPLYDIQKWVGAGGRALFDALLVFENYPAHRGANAALRLGAVQTEESTNYALTIGVASGETLDVMFEYDRAHFDDAGIARLGAHFSHLVREITRDASRRLGDIALTLDPPRDEPAPRGDAFDGALSIEGRIAQLATETPDAIALDTSARRVSYAELNREASAVGRALRERGVGMETVVAVCMRRSAEAVIAMLGIWKAGAAFLPIDPSYPAQRVRAMIESSGATLLIADLEEGNQGRRELEGIARLDLRQIRRAASDDFTVSVDASALAYVISTSGSTGTPKAVGVSRAALLHHVRAALSLYETTAIDVALHFASWSFDAAIEQWVVPLLAGARLVLSDDATWPVETLASEIERRHLTQIDLPPAYLADLVRHLVAEERTLDLRLCIVGGEALPGDVFDSVRRALPRARIVNAYGPTEAVVTPMAWSPDAGSICATEYAPIGVPIGDRVAYVLDGALHPLPPGVAGELCVGGPALARGYLGRPDLTALHFVPDPAGPPGARMYRTGDRARWLESGVAEFRGRRDDQIKLRGFRIELGEIEAKLRAVSAIEGAVAVLRDDRLVAYVVDAKQDAAREERATEIRDELRRSLPVHMVPSAVVFLKQLPRTPSGKVDKKSLPPPDANRTSAPPTSPIEIEIAAIWKELLGVDAVGRDDHFFEIGGHSLRALAFVTRIGQRFGVEIPLARFLERPTIAAVGDWMQGAAPRTSSPLVPLNGSPSTRPPLFCLHAAGGTVFAYDEVARKIAPDRPAIGVLCRSFVDPSFEDTSLDEMSRAYAALLCEAQPEGAFALLGWSLGGALAVGVAHHLEQRGRTVQFLGFVDGFVPNVPLSKHRDADSEAAPAAIDIAPEESGTLAQFRPEEIAMGRAVMDRLTVLARDYALPRVRVRPHCWWASETANDAMLAQQTLERALHQMPKWSAIIPSTHTTILRSPEFLESLRHALRAAPFSSPALPRSPS